MKAKAKGTRAEHRVMKLLELTGYECARAAGSFGVFDVFGFNENEVLLVQVKVNRTVSPAEREQMRLFRAPRNARKLVYVFTDRLRQPKVEEIR